MIRQVSCLLAALSISVWAAQAQAAPVNVDGTLWYQPAELTNYSYSDFASVCSTATGVCAGSLPAAGPDLTGWTWASIDEVNALFNYFIGSAQLGPGPDEYSQQGSAWAPAMLAAFNPTGSAAQYEVVVGITRSVYSLDPVFAASSGFVLNVLPVTGLDRARTDSFINFQNHSGPLFGGWLYASPIPVPAAAWLFGSALIGLAAVARRKSV
jgi:hypothetical protein